MLGRGRFTRRRVLGSSVVGAVASALHMWPSGEVDAQGPAEEREFHGLLLLPWGAAIPPRARFPRSRVPSLDGPAPTAVWETLPAHAVPAEYRIPIYHLNEGALDLHERPAQILSHISRDIFAVFIVYDEEPLGQAIPMDQPLVITIMPRYPQPYPLFPGGNPDDGIIDIETVDWLPRPGAVLRAGEVEDAWWIDESTLFRLTYRSLDSTARASSPSLEDVATSLHRLTSHHHP